MSKSNIDVRLYTSEEVPQEIVVDSWLKRLLELYAIPGALDEYEVSVRNVHPCPGCGEGVALVRMGHELRIVNAIYDRENSQPFNRRWTANILAEHTCAEVRQ